jgi:VWFA-related protein
MPSAAHILLLLALAVPVGFSASRAPIQPAADDHAAPVRLDVIVSNRQGHLVFGLRPSDFELLEDGSPRPISTLEVRTIPLVSRADTSPIESASDEQRAAGQPGTRVFAFFLDEFHVSPGASAERARDVVAHFIDEKVGPQDLAAVIRPQDSVTAVGFTRDRALLHGVIGAFSGRKGSGRKGDTAATAARDQAVRAGLRDLMMRLGELKPDRGVVVLVSEGFSREDPTAPTQDLQRVVQASSRFHLAMYTFNPATADEDVSPPAERERAVPTLQWLAEQTGGLAIDTETLISGFARVAHDTAAYYALTYEPALTDGRFHAIEIRTTRRDVQVRTQPGYWAMRGSEWRALFALRAAIRPMARRSLRRSTLIKPWIGLRRDPAGRARMLITWEPREPDSRSAQVVVVKARTATGEALFEGPLARVGDRSGSVRNSVRFDVPPGRVEMDMTILDADGHVLDAEVRDFDVPDLGPSQKPGPVLLSPEIVRTRTLRDFETAIANPDAAPSSLRAFGHGDRLLIRACAFDPAGTAVQVTANVLNGRGQFMRGIDSTRRVPREGVTEFALPILGLAPGEYQIELLGTNRNGSIKERLVFRVVG